MGKSIRQALVGVLGPLCKETRNYGLCAAGAFTYQRWSAPACTVVGLAR